MTNPNFEIVALPTAIADQARQHVDNGAKDHRAVGADSPNGFPCRHCLEWAKPGERMVLFPYAAIPAGHPFSESGPIFVHEERCERYARKSQYPDAFRNGRVFRAYNQRFDMIDAQPLNDASAEAMIENLFGNPETAFVDVRSADRGCFTLRIVRQ